jgi:hypothetical protein
MVTCETSTLKAKAAASFISLSVIGGLATQPVNNSARQVLTDISRIHIFILLCESAGCIYERREGGVDFDQLVQEGVFFGNWPELLKLS